MKKINPHFKLYKEVAFDDRGDLYGIINKKLDKFPIYFLILDGKGERVNLIKKYNQARKLAGNIDWKLIII